jgi:pyruvate/2-oxoglutarate dehydrogenase complex dihydrolipoamide acyltransferase (E2) component
MTEGTLVAWKKKKGDQVSTGEVLAEIETDKATMEWESPEDGTLTEIYVQEGGKVNVGDRIAFIGGEDEETPKEEEKEKEKEEKEEKPKAKEEEKKEEKPKKGTLGTIERLDSAFDDLIAKGEKLENANNIGLGTYIAELSEDGNRLDKGKWSSDGAPGGWGIWSLYALDTNSPQSQKLPEASIVMI